MSPSLNEKHKTTEEDVRNMSKEHLVELEYNINPCEQKKMNRSNT